MQITYTANLVKLEIKLFFFLPAATEPALVGTAPQVLHERHLMFSVIRATVL